MAKTINQIVIATDTFSSLITRTNQVISALGSEIITANSSNDGANTTGNTNLIGIFGANTVAVGTALRGGTVNAAANLSVTSNVVFTGANASFTANVNMNNSATTINAVAMYITGPTLTLSSNTTASGNLALTGAQLTVSANAVYTGGNTTVQSTNFNISSNTTTFSGNTVSFTGANVAIASNTSFSGVVNASANVNVSADLFYGTRYRITGVSNTDLGATTGAAINVASWPIAWNSADIHTRVGNTTATRASKILVVSASNNAYMTEYAVLGSPNTSNLGVYSISANTTDVILRFTPYVANMSLTLNINLAD
jgi:hypothetical protein